MLPDFIINKILLYNIHPVAEIVRKELKIFSDLDIQANLDMNFQEFICMKSHFCWKCHCFIMFTDISMVDKIFCESCFNKTDPNDDDACYTATELLEFKIMENKIRYNIFDEKMI